MFDYLLLKYDKEDELYVPIHQIDKITRYIGPENIEPKLTRLGKTSWEVLKRKVKKSTQLLARELVEHYAKRELAKAKAIRSEDSEDYIEFANQFEFKETEDQIRAVNEIVNDLSKTIPMNRLLVGDVGFGKTEVMMRAAFKIAEIGGQIAILAPTTILAAQHFKVLKKRFENFPIEIGLLSRFNTTSKNKEIVKSLNENQIDIVIGTHRLLSNDVKFKKLQLLIVDEEQRFGVKQKEKIKKLNYGTHVLSVSATPIPRTFGRALSSIQDLSIITTPPVGRKSIITEIIKDNWNKVTKAIADEVSRGGQVYFLHNEVRTIQTIMKKLQLLLPGIKFITAHGQLSSKELERIMNAFFLQKYDVLICTTIIENGLDIKNVNTMVVNKANKFGLSQLYQLRGRIGRGMKQAYCYFLYEGKSFEQEKLDLNPDPKSSDYLIKKKLKPKKYLERLQTLVDNQELGAGFKVASKDLEIRGAGNLLGGEQSGHITSIGYALYINILAQEVEKRKGEFSLFCMRDNTEGCT